MLLTFSLGFVLLINIDVKFVIDNVPGEPFRYPGGVRSVNDFHLLDARLFQNLSQHNLDFCRFFGIMTFLAAMGGMGNSALSATLVYRGSENNCTTYFLMGGTLLPSKPNYGLRNQIDKEVKYITMQNTPFYYLKLCIQESKFDFDVEKECRSYGFFHICARNVEIQSGITITYIGRSPNTSNPNT